MYNLSTNNLALVRLKKIFKKFLVKKKLNLSQIKHNKIFIVKKKKNLIITRKNSHFLWNLNLKRQIYNHTHFFECFNLYNKFISFVFKNGIKGVWEKNFSSIFFILRKKLNYSRSFILLKIFMRLHTKVELRTIKTRRRINLVPFFIKIKRRFFLALKWLLKSIKRNKMRVSLKEKLLLEILVIFQKKSCFSIQELKTNNLLAYKNRANSHFRW
jgi:small subunit ribosomal protein S7